MRKFEFTRNSRRYKRVNRKRAKNLFLKGEEVFCWPCNMDPSNPHWGGLYSSANFYEYEPLDEDRFEKWEANATYYNCDNERGRYLSFYEEVAI